MDKLEVFNQHRPLLFSIAYNMLSSAMDAEDMVQEVYLRWAGSPDVESPRAYLSAIRRTCAIDTQMARGGTAWPAHLHRRQRNSQRSRSGAAWPDRYSDMADPFGCARLGRPDGSGDAVSPQAWRISEHPLQSCAACSGSLCGPWALGACSPVTRVSQPKMEV